MGKKCQRAGRGAVLADRGRLGAVLPVLVGAVLRLLRLGAQDLWYDEAVTAWIARLPLRDLLPAVVGDVHPPLWYLVEWLSVRFPGNTAIALRLPAALCSIAALAMLPGLARALKLDRRTAVIATWIMALAPFQIWYAQEGRMYALLLLAVEVAVWAAVRRRWARYVAAIVVMMYTHNVFVVYWATLIAFFAFMLAFVVFAVQYLGRGVGNYDFDYTPFKAPLLANGIAALLYVPWFSIASRQAGAVAGSFWVQRPALGALPLTLHELLWGTIPPPFLGVFVVFVSALAVIAGIWAGRGKRWDLLWLAFAPLLLTWSISQLKPVLISRLMIGCTPFLYLLLAKAMVDHRRVRWLAWLAVPLVVFVLALYFVDPAVQKGDVHRFVEPVQAQYRDGDAVLHTCIPSYVLLSYYAPEMDHYLWRQANDLSQSLTDQTKRAMGMRETTIEELLQAHARVWVYYSDSPVSSAAEIAENARIRAAYGTHWEKDWAVTVEKTDLIESGVYLVQTGTEKEIQRCPLNCISGSSPRCSLFHPLSTRKP